MAKAKTYELRIVSAVVIDGEIVAPGKIAKGLPEKLAKNLLQRGKAEVPSGAASPSKAAGPISTSDDDDQNVALADHTVAELKELAAEYEIEGAANMNKADLIAAIEKAEAE